jgi:hypothetical protein
MWIKKWLEKLGSVLLPILLKGCELLMSIKQDRSAARTAADIERKYSFGKKFSEILGVIDESRDKVDSVSSTLGEVKTSVSELSRDTESLNFKVTEIVDKGVDHVETTTGFRFDHSGLNISKSGEEMKNQLDNTGMYVYRSGDVILSATNEGVKATNLHAKTYLIIGADNGRSRIEDYDTVSGEKRTGVFWIGG